MGKDQHTLSKNELEIRLRELEKEYELATRGLNAEFAMMRLAMLLVVILLLFGGLSLIPVIKEWISGFQVVIIIVVSIVSVLAYFALVFGRAARIQAELSETKKPIEIEIGKKVR